MKQFFKKIAQIFQYKIAVISIAFAVLFSIIVVHLFNIQIIKGGEYKKGLTTTIEKVVPTYATRGRILDKNGVVLAYDELVYSVNIADSGTYANKKEKNKLINSSIIETLRIITENGDHYSNDFKLTFENNEYKYTVSDIYLLRFLRNCYGVAKVSQLTEKQKNTTANELVEYLIKYYDVDVKNLNPTTEELIELFDLRVKMTANSYSRYISFPIANEINEKTMAALLERSKSLVGITVDQKNVRRYNDAKYFSGIIGYTGVVSEDEINEKDEKGKLKYTSNDTVGKSGIEKSFENYLAGKKGEKVVYLDTVGRITKVIKEDEALAGNDVYLTIDANMQKKLYDIVENELTEIIIEKLRAGGSKYHYTADNYIDDIYILYSEVYYYLIKNNLVRLSSIENPKNDLERQVGAIYKNKRQEVLGYVKGELENTATPYEKLEENNKLFISSIYQMLVNDGIIKTDVIDYNDKMFVKWQNGKDISLKDFLRYALSKNWIDLSEISNEKYTQLNVAYETLSSYILENIQTYRDFKIIIFKDLIEKNQITGWQVAMLLYDGGYLKKEGLLYEQLKNGVIGSNEFIVRALREKVLTPGELGVRPSSGGAIVENPYDGTMLAMVSYPGYNTNKITGDMDVNYYSTLQYNSSSPMLNWATSATCAPGSIFKLLSSVAALEEGVVNNSTIINCTGLYTDITPHPRCWVYPSSHGNEDITHAIRDSCNIYFYTVGNRLGKMKDGTYDSDYGTKILKNYAVKLGLATKSGIEIEEAAPKASDTSSIFTAIGQGNAAYTCVNIARYVSTITTNGDVYDSRLVDRISTSDGKVIEKKESKLSSKIEDVSANTWNKVKEGMILATATYPELNKFSGKVACKTGTSQPSEKEPDNATFVSYAPLDKPEITLSIEIPFGYTSLYNTKMAATFYEYYFNEYKTQIR